MTPPTTSTTPSTRCSRPSADTLLIVVIVIFLFLGSFRSVLVPVVAIPISLIGAVFLMQVFGFTINLLTLLAIVLSVGLVVDDAIVVVENVERHLGEGKSPLEAALLGARELVGPIIAMTITLAAVYLPIGLQGGLTGSLFREFAFTLAGAVTISGIVALTLSPVMSVKTAQDRVSRSMAWPDGSPETSSVSRMSTGACSTRTLHARPAVYTVWIVISLLTIPDVHHVRQGTGAGRGPGGHLRHRRRRRQLDARPDQPFRRAVNRVFMSVPETDFTFQITLPNSGFGGMVVKPWGERKRNVFQIMPEVQRKLQQHPRHPDLPGDASGPARRRSVPGGVHSGLDRRHSADSGICPANCS